MSNDQPSDQSPESKEQAQQRQQRIMQRSTLLSLIGGLLFGLFGYVLYKTSTSPYEEQVKSVILHSEPIVSMKVLQQAADGGWGDLDHVPNVGDKVAFRISSTHPIHVALFAEANRMNKHLIFDYVRIPPGENYMFKVNNSPYIYQVGKNEEHVVFCMVVVADPEKLSRALGPVLSQLHLDDLPKEHCASW